MKAPRWLTHGDWYQAHHIPCGWLSAETSAEEAIAELDAHKLTCPQANEPDSAT